MHNILPYVLGLIQIHTIEMNKHYVSHQRQSLADWCGTNH